MTSSTPPWNETGTRTLRLACLLSLVLITALSMGCSVHRTLRLTEIGKDKIELYLDEKNTNLLTLRDHRLFVNAVGATDNTHSVLDLSIFGRDLKGGEFLIVWEDGGHSGAPVAQEYTGGQLGAVPGIKVEPSFFKFGNMVAGEVRLAGSHSRGAVTDLTDDCVRFGDPTNRPRTGGAFMEDNSLPMPSPTWPLQRWWTTATSEPLTRDTDHESDWVPLRIGTWGVKTN